jgi:hypothetical protein
MKEKSKGCPLTSPPLQPATDPSTGNFINKGTRERKKMKIKEREIKKAM